MITIKFNRYNVYIVCYNYNDVQIIYEIAKEDLKNSRKNPPNFQLSQKQKFLKRKIRSFGKQIHPQLLVGQKQLKSFVPLIVFHFTLLQLQLTCRLLLFYIFILFYKVLTEVQKKKKKKKIRHITYCIWQKQKVAGTLIFIRQKPSQQYHHSSLILSSLT